MYTPQQLTETKSLDEIPEEYIRMMELVSLPKEDGILKPFGSFINRSAQYWGDIDLLQQYNECCTIEEVGQKTAEHFKKILGDINANDDMWFSELKAGLDDRYDIDIGYQKDGMWYIADNLNLKIYDLFNRNLISIPELQYIDSILIKQHKSAQDYDNVYYILRNRRILRWTDKEVFRGYKRKSEKTFYLKDSVIQQTPLKIDILTQDSNGKFMEITNFISLTLNQEPINIDLKVDADPINLMPEIEKLYFSNKYFSPFKMTKRAFAFLKAIFKGSNKDLAKLRGLNTEYTGELLEKYYQVLNSTLGILYNVRSELDVMRLLMKQKNPPVKRINERLAMLKTPLSNVLEINEEELKEQMKIIAAIIAERENKERRIEEFMDILNKIIDFHTIDYFQQLDINPPPKSILPYELKYAYYPRTAEESIKGGFVKKALKKAFQKIANAYRRKFCQGRARMLFPGEYHLGCHNFTGPGTHIRDKKVRDFPAYNAIDECSKQHDIDYLHAVEGPEKDRKEAIKKADRDVLECYDKHKDVSGYNIAHRGINAKMKLDKVIPIVSRSVFGDISAGATERHVLNYLPVENIGKL